GLVQRPSAVIIAANVTVNTEQSFDGSAVWPPNAVLINVAFTVALAAIGDTFSLRSQAGMDSGPTVTAEAAGQASYSGAVAVDGETVLSLPTPHAPRAGARNH